MSETKFCFSKKTSVAACARMFISIWSTEERISATSLIGRRECSETASRLVEIWCMRQMPATPTSNATAIATAKPAKMRALTLRVAHGGLDPWQLQGRKSHPVHYRTRSETA